MQSGSAMVNGPMGMHLIASSHHQPYHDPGTSVPAAFTCVTKQLCVKQHSMYS